MKIVIIILFALTVLGGTYLATLIFTNKKIEKSAALIHGFIGALAISVLAYFAYIQNNTKLWVALGIFIVAAIGGLYLYNNDRKGSAGPKSAVVIHATVAIAGIILLLLTIF